MPRRILAKFTDPRILTEKASPQDGEERHIKSKNRPRPRSVSVNLSESPLGWLHARGHLTDRQYDGGEKLRRDWERANLAPNVTMSWDMAPVSRGPRSGSNSFSQTDAQIAARQRFDGALKHIGDDLSDIAWRIICGGEGVPAAEKNLGWPARSGKLVLRIALDRLAEYYKLPG